MMEGKVSGTTQNEVRNANLQREAVAVLDDVASLESTVEDLKAAGFAGDDISLLATDETVERKLGHIYRRVEELEDDPSAPRTAFVSSRDFVRRERVVMATLTYIPTLIAAGTVVASAGAVAAALAGVAVGGASLATLLTHWMDTRHANWLQDQIDRGGILVWVRTPDTAAERKALEILGRYSAHDVHIHGVPAARA